MRNNNINNQHKNITDDVNNYNDYDINSNRYFGDNYGNVNNRIYFYASYSKIKSEDDIDI